MYDTNEQESKMNNKRIKNKKIIEKQIKDNNKKIEKYNIKNKPFEEKIEDQNKSKKNIDDEYYFRRGRKPQDFKSINYKSEWIQTGYAFKGKVKIYSLELIHFEDPFYILQKDDEVIKIIMDNIKEHKNIEVYFQMESSFYDDQFYDGENKYHYIENKNVYKVETKNDVDYCINNGKIKKTNNNFKKINFYNPDYENIKSTIKENFFNYRDQYEKMSNAI